MGFWKKAKPYVKEVGEDFARPAKWGYKKYKKYQKEAPQRQEKRIENLKRDVQEAKLKGQLAKERRKSPGFNFGGFAGPTQKKPSPALGVADYLTGGAPDLFGTKRTSSPRKKTRHRRKQSKRRSSGKTITIKMG